MIDLHHGRARTLWLIVQGIVPVLLIALIVTLILVTTSTQHQLDTARRDGRKQAAHVACTTVHVSDKALSDFFDHTIATGPRAHDPIAARFLADLRATQAATYARCLADADDVK